jgi:hypothetical protein
MEVEDSGGSGVGFRHGHDRRGLCSEEVVHWILRTAHVHHSAAHGMRSVRVSQATQAPSSRGTGFRSCIPWLSSQELGKSIEKTFFYILGRT